MKKAYWFITFFIVIGCFVGCYLHLNDGFCTPKILTYRIQDSRYDLPPLPVEERAVVDAILEQPFHYLGKGRQSFVFESEDGKYVLKLVKQYKYWHLDDVLKIPMPNKLYNHVQKLINIRNTKKFKHLRSYKMTFERLKDESRILYLHINRDPTLHKMLTIVDQLGMKHRLSTERLVFFLQEKAVVAEEYFNQLQQTQDIIRGKQAIDSIVELLFAYYRNGLTFSDLDKKFLVNLGFRDDQAIILDAGGSRVMQGQHDPLWIKEHLFESTKSFRASFRETNPELADYFEERIVEKSNRWQ